ncbi:hypothetical protein VNO77_19293 [Canavalia gladiata]|uniref:Uncharacterized protein n=1 Tax=Canavalia gladiata TaxID=3824 RepID=A0AAN9LMG3_CANGL
MVLRISPNLLQTPIQTKAVCLVSCLSGPSATLITVTIKLIKGLNSIYDQQTLPETSAQKKTRSSNRLGASLGYTWSESELESSLAGGSHVTGKARLDLRLLTFAIGSARLPCSCDLHRGAPLRWPATCFWLGSSLNRAALLPCFHNDRACTLPAASSYLIQDLRSDLVWPPLPIYHIQTILPSLNAFVALLTPIGVPPLTSLPIFYLNLNGHRLNIYEFSDSLFIGDVQRI